MASKKGGRGGGFAAGWILRLPNLVKWILRVPNLSSRVDIKGSKPSRVDIMGSKPITPLCTRRIVLLLGATMCWIPYSS